MIDKALFYVLVSFWLGWIPGPQGIAQDNANIRNVDLLGAEPKTDLTDPKTLSLLHWNVESGGNDPQTIVDQLFAMGPYDIYGLSEVDDPSFYEKAFEEKWPGQYSFRSGQSGAYRDRENDHLLLIINKGEMQVGASVEIANARGHTFNDGRHRNPLSVLLEKNGERFEVILNHFARGDAELRKQQAIAHREAARTVSASHSMIALGDYSFDFDFRTQQGNDAFREFTHDGIWKWIKPEKLIDTNWSDRDNDGQDDDPNSLSDFSFVAGPAKEWNATCRVIVRNGDFPDDDKTSDHRPVELIINGGDSSDQEELDVEAYFNRRPTGISIQEFWDNLPREPDRFGHCETGRGGDCWVVFEYEEEGTFWCTIDAGNQIAYWRKVDENIWPQYFILGKLRK